jgi:DNA modification methylase
VTTTVTFVVGDVRDVMAAMPASSVDLVVTSPPFGWLRSYLPSDHEHKRNEIGQEANPAAYLDTMLDLTDEWRRLLVPTGSLAVELGDTYAGSGGAGGDYNPGGLREGQAKVDGSGRRSRTDTKFAKVDDGRPGGGITNLNGKVQPGGVGFPMPKSLCGIPTLYTWSLAYGRNLLNPDHRIEPWRIRNLLTWTRPNPPVGALGDKFRPATSFVTVACTSDKRWFDLDAVRTEHQSPYHVDKPVRPSLDDTAKSLMASHDISHRGNPAGAPPLDWWDASDAEAWQPLHRLPTQPYSGSHYAAFPVELPRRLIQAMCPLQVCQVCGEPRRRIVGEAEYVSNGKVVEPHVLQSGIATAGAHSNKLDGNTTRVAPTLGWTDCGHDDNYRPGHVLDPFGGSGTTAVAAALCGRDATLIDLDSRNLDLCRKRLRETVGVLSETVDGDTTTWTVRADLPGLKGEHPDQQSLFEEATA